MCQLLVVLLFSFYSFQQYGEGTRFLPMVVWDHVNPMLKCRNNWLRIPNIDVYDRMDFVCPSPKLAVKLLDGYSRPTSEMNENIFMRKWHQRSDQTDKTLLKEMLLNGSLCNPDESVTLHTCRDGEEGKSLTVSFSPDRDEPNKNYVRDDLVVFFNNGDNGKASTLSDTSSRCTMVFIANITWLVGDVHNLSYRKCLDPDDAYCNNINATTICHKYEETRCQSSTMPSSSSSLSPSPSLSQTVTSTEHALTKINNTLMIVNTSSSQFAMERITSNTSYMMIVPTTPFTIKETTTVYFSPTTNITNISSSSQPNVILLESGRAAKSQSFDKNYFGFGVGVGIIFMLVFVVLPFFIYRWYKNKEKHTPAKHPHQLSTPKGHHTNRVSSARENKGYDKTPTTNGSMLDFNQTDGNSNSTSEQSLHNMRYSNNLPPPNCQEATNKNEMDV